MKKKILIVGEFSGVGKVFKQGFQENDCEVDLISDGDGYKAISNLHPMFQYPLFRYLILILQGCKASFKRYDRVIWLSPFVFKRPLFVIKILNTRLLKVSNIHVLYCCTTDSIYWRYYPKDTDRNPLYGFLFDTNFETHRFAKEKFFKYQIKFLKKMTSVIACSEEYEKPYAKFLRRSIEIVRIPIRIPPKTEVDVKPIIASHGITREGIKGTNEIAEYFEINKIPLNICRKITFARFEEVLKFSRIYVDQYLSHFPGVAALFALVYCEVVVAGYRKDLVKDSQYALECPFVDLKTFRGNLMDLLDPEQVNFERIEINRQFLRKWHDPKNQTSLLL